MNERGKEENLPRLRLMASRSHRDQRVDDVRRRLGISEESRIGSAGIKGGLLVTRHAAAGQLILIGDALHNFVDGIVTSAAFLSAIPLGIAIGIAVIAHEVPLG